MEQIVAFVYLIHIWKFNQISPVQTRNLCNKSCNNDILQLCQSKLKIQLLVSNFAQKQNKDRQSTVSDFMQNSIGEALVTE